jgi:hypothetical protein
VVGSLNCPKCSMAVMADQAYCGKCGTPLPGTTASQPTIADIAPQVSRAGAQGGASQPGRTRGKASPAPAAGTSAAGVATPAGTPDSAALDVAIGTSTDPRLTALGLSYAAPPGPAQPQATTAAPPPSAPNPFATAPAATAGLAQGQLGVPARNPFAPPAVAQFAPPAVAQFAPPAAVESVAEPVAGVSEHIPGGYVAPLGDPATSAWTLRPSSASSDTRPAGPSLSVSVGAIPVSSVENRSPAEDDNPAEPPSARQASWSSAARPAPRSPFAASSAPTAAAPPLRPTSFPVPSVAAPTGGANVQATGAAGKESTQELVAFGLVAAGTVVGIASLFLPWAASNGIGVGTTGSSPPPNGSGWLMPASMPLFLLSGLVLGAASGSDRAKERLPNLAVIIGRVTDSIMPMVLGGLYLGVFLLYLTLPWGCGPGAFALLFGGVLLLAGATVTLFSSPEPVSRPNQGRTVER